MMTRRDARFVLPRALPMLLLVLSLAPALRADDHQPIYILGGLDHRDRSSGSRVGEHGIYLGFGYVSGEPGLLQTGSAGVDLEWRHSARHGNKLDSFDVCYSERLFDLAGGLYLGYGVGSAYHRLSRPVSDGGSSKGWRIMGKLMIGYDLGGGPVVEAAYLRSGAVGGLDTSGFTLAIGCYF